MDNMNVLCVIFCKMFILQCVLCYQVSVDETYREVKELGNYIKSKAIVFEDPSDVSIYYNIHDHHMIKDMMPRPWITPGQSLKLPFIGQPCSCSNLQCGCCAGINITQFNFDKQACANLTYDPFLFALILDVTINNDSVVHQVYSAKNPPPICIPVVISGIPTGIDFCIKLYDIHTTGTNLHVCIDFETRIASAPVLVLHFDCVRLGTDGIAIVKPDQGDEEIAASDHTTTDSSTDVYDQVTEIKKKTTTFTPDFEENEIKYLY